MIFKGEYAFLSNMYLAPVTLIVKGVRLTFKCSESAFQAMKCPDKARAFADIDGYAAKRKGKTVPLRPDWDRIKVKWMEKVVTAKFKQNAKLAKMLIATGDEELIEDNTWHDTFWGMYNGQGRNELGKILMKVRDNLKEEMR